MGARELADLILAEEKLPGDHVPEPVEAGAVRVFLELDDSSRDTHA